jgi:hypothetical protein
VTPWSKMDRVRPKDAATMAMPITSRSVVCIYGAKN